MMTWTKSTIVAIAIMLGVLALGTTATIVAVRARGGTASPSTVRSSGVATQPAATTGEADWQQQRLKLIKSATNMAHILQAMLRYAKDRHGNWPASLDDVLGPGATQTLINPVHPNLKPAYIYIKPADKMAPVNPETMVLYESHQKFGEGVNVGFADGHVEFVSNEKRFNEMKAAAKGVGK